MCVSRVFQNVSGANQKKMSDENSIDERDIGNLRQLVIEYLALGPEIKELEEPVKQRKARQKELNQEILDFMKAHNVTFLNIPEEAGGGTLVAQNSVTKTAIKKDNWNKGVTEFLRKRNIDATFDEVVQEVNSTRETVANMSLKKQKK